MASSTEVRLPGFQIRFCFFARLRLLVLGLLLMFATSSANAWFWESPTWQSINADLKEDYPQVTHATTQDLEQRLVDRTRPLPLLIDARALDEYSVSHIAGAKHAETVEQVQALLRGRADGTDVFVYCSVGVRSARLVAKLQAAGVKQVVNLKGSIFEWANRGLPVYRDGEPAAGVHPFNRKWGKLLDRRYWSHEP